MLDHQHVTSIKTLGERFQYVTTEVILIRITLRHWTGGAWFSLPPKGDNITSRIKETKSKARCRIEIDSQFVEMQLLAPRVSDHCHKSHRLRYKSVCSYRNPMPAKLKPPPLVSEDTNLVLSSVPTLSLSLSTKGMYTWMKRCNTMNTHYFDRKTLL